LIKLEEIIGVYPKSARIIGVGHGNDE